MRIGIPAAIAVIAIIAIVGGVLFAACDNDDELVGVELGPTIDWAADDLHDFWSDTLDDLGYGDYYEGPRRVEFYQPDEPEETACGETIPNNAFYCTGDNSIYMDEVFMQRAFDEAGPFASVYILAHEWAHLVQFHLDIFDGTSFTIQLELQADCLAGVYTRDLDDRDAITDENLLEAVVTLILVGDPILLPWWGESAHGSPQQRVSAYESGYTNGWDSCIQPPAVPPQVEPES